MCAAARRVRAAAGQFDVRREGAVARVEQHSVGDGKEMSPSSTSRSPSPSTSAAAIQLDARRKGATAHVKQHSVDTAIVSKQHVEVAVAVHRQRYSPKNLLPLILHRRLNCRPERDYSAIHARALLGAGLTPGCQHQRDPGQ